SFRPFVKCLFDEPIIGKRSQRPTDQWPYNRNPPVVPRSRESIFAPSCKPCEQTRSEVTCRIDRIPCICPKGNANRHNSKTDNKRRHVFQSTKTDVFLINQRVYEHNQ